MGPAQAHEHQDESVRDELARLREVQSSRDFPELEKLIGDVFSRKRRPNEHLELAREFCATLNSVNFKNDKQAEILQRIAVKTVVELDKELSVGLRVQLVRYIQLDHEYRQEKLRGGEWATVRREYLRMWLKAFRHLDKGIDRSFDFDDRPQRNVTPPGNKYRAGVSPESIREPEIREQYVKLLKANAKKKERYVIQSEFRDLEKVYLQDLELNVVRAYSFKPFSIDEIRENFDEFGVPKELTARVVKQLESRMLAEIELDAKLAKLPPVKGILDTTPKTGLGADARLRVRLSVNFKVPLVEEVLSELRKATGVTLTRADDVQNQYYVSGSYSFTEVPAWQIMETLASSKYVQGEWQTDGQGYRLVRNGNPVAEPSAPPTVAKGAGNDFEDGPGASMSNFAFWLTVVPAIAILVLVLTILWRRWHNARQTAK